MMCVEEYITRINEQLETIKQLSHDDSEQVSEEDLGRFTFELPERK